MLAQLLGQAVPPLPSVPGRIHLMPDDDDESDPAPSILPPNVSPERAGVLSLPLSDAEAGALLGITRQRAWQLRRELRRSLEDQR